MGGKVDLLRVFQYKILYLLLDIVNKFMSLRIEHLYAVELSTVVRARYHYACICSQLFYHERNNRHGYDSQKHRIRSYRAYSCHYSGFKGV